MHLYSDTTAQFLRDVKSDRLVARLEGRFVEEFRFHPPDGEVRAWQNSLAAMASVVDEGGLHDHGVLVEYQLPLSSRRLDFMLTGHSSAGSPGAVIVELKQWDYVEPSWVDDCVSTFVGMRERDVLHPSAQAGGYRRYLVDTNTAFEDGTISLDACAYLHNLSRSAAGELFARRYERLLDESPAFVADDSSNLTSFLVERLEAGSGQPVLDRVIAGKYKPHKQLLEHTAKAIRNEPAWILLDEQQVAFNAVLTKVRERHQAEEQTAFLIRGGPGTGKSVVAVNLVAALSADGYTTQHATGS